MRPAEVFREQDGWRFFIDSAGVSTDPQNIMSTQNGKRYICRDGIHWVLQITKLTPLVFQSLNTQIHHLGTKVSTESKLHCFRGQRDGSAVRITSCSSRGTKFDSQHPFRAAHNCLSLQLQGIQHPVLAPTGTAFMCKTPLPSPLPQTHIHIDPSGLYYLSDISPCPAYIFSVNLF